MKKFVKIQLETIQGCDRRCWHCPNKDIKHHYTLMKVSLIKKILDELAEIKFQGIFYLYLMNEPFLDKRMPRIVDLAQRYIPLVTIDIATNGQALSLELAEELADKGVSLWIDAYEREVYDRFQPLKEKMMIADLSSTSSSRIPPSFYNRGGNVEIDNGFPIDGYCERPFSQMYIRYNGKAVLCCSDYHFEAVMGDVNKNTLMEIFNNEKYEQYRESLRVGKRDLPLCNKCNWRQI